MKKLLFVAVIGATMSLVACGGGDSKPAGDSTTVKTADTASKMVDTAKKMVDSASKKIDSAAKK